MSNPSAYSSIERTLSVLLSPLDHATPQAWQRAAHAQLVELTHADSLCVYSPLAAGADAWYAPHLSANTLAQYADHAAEDPEWDIIETGFSQLTSTTGKPVAHESEFVSARARKTSAFHREFLAPNGLNDLTVAGAAIGTTRAARLHFANRTWRGEAAHLEREQLVRAVLPAFRSGLGMWYQLGHRRAELAGMFDTLSDALMLFDADSALVHANPSAAALVSGLNSAHALDAERLRNEALQVARRINAMLRHAGVGAPTMTPSAATRDVRTSKGVVTVRGAIAPAWMFGRGHGVLVTLERHVTTGLTDADLQQRFGLTAREVEVARFLADGLSNQDLAARLGVSFFTARNHVEKVLTKMGAKSRAQVGAVIRTQGEAAAA
jgi:DNA-binding CsgD family transcriptional regulator